MEWFAKRLKVHERYKQMCAGERRKGFSKRQLLQMEKLKNKIVRLPEFPPRALIVHKSIKGR
jgi:hypothetical protein